MTDAIRVTGYGSDVVRDFLMDGSSNVLFTCGEDGHVRAWGSDETSASASVGHSEDMSSKISKKKPPKRGKEFRARPY